MKDTITDHAVLRWIERRYGVDVEGEREKIRRIATPYLAMKNIIVKRDGLKFCIRDGHLVTILLGDMVTTTRLPA